MALPAPQRTPPTEPGRVVLTVSQLTGLVKETLEGRFAGLWVTGEISNLRAASSGHIYFTLKDEGAQVRAVLFRGRARRLRFDPADGLSVLAFGSLDVYAPRGEYQLVCEVLEPRGLGALQLAFEQLKARLAAEGLFDQTRKRPLPAFPRRVGLITSPTGAVVRDFLRVVTRRFAGLGVLICPVRVQGETAATEIAEALAQLNRLGDLDVIVLARGGGSLEDLWAFNEEVVARAIAGSKIPVVSAVGHETDVTVADFVADLRAPTPSAAAELVVREKAELARRVADLGHRLAAGMSQRVGRLRERVDDLARRRVFTDPARPLRDLARRLDDFGLRLGRGLDRHRLGVRERVDRIGRALRPALLRGQVRHGRQLVDQLGGRLRRAAAVEVARRRHVVEALAGRLDTLSPLACLARGYAVCLAGDGRPMTRADAVTPGARVAVRLAVGALGCRVETVTLADPEGPGDPWTSSREETPRGRP